MTSSSDSPGKTAAEARPAYARFIPREELQAFSAWTPDAFGTPAGAGPRPAAPAGEAAGAPVPDADLDARLHAARQAGYQDGYRDGLVALEGFKRSFAQQMATQVAQLLQAFDGQLDALEQQMADAVARTSAELARQVVRSELAVRPELVARVAQDAVNAVLMSARHISVHVHPEDQALVAEGAAEALAARGARLVASSEIARGGCLIESDVGRTDARIASRWAQAAALLGLPTAWQDEPAESGE